VEGRAALPGGGDVVEAAELADGEISRRPRSGGRMRTRDLDSVTTGRAGWRGRMGRQEQSLRLVVARPSWEGAGDAPPGGRAAARSGGPDLAPALPSPGRVRRRRSWCVAPRRGDSRCGAGLSGRPRARAGRQRGSRAGRRLGQHGAGRRLGWGVGIGWIWGWEGMKQAGPTCRTKVRDPPVSNAKNGWQT